MVTGKKGKRKGKASLPINANGNYRIVVTKDNYHPKEDWSEEVNCDLDNCPCNVTLSTPLEPMKCENVTLSIHIRDVDTQEGIPEANVTVNTETNTGPMTWNVVTDETGKAVIPIDPMGDFEISVSAPGYVPHQKLKPIECDVHDCEPAHLPPVLS